MTQLRWPIRLKLIVGLSLVLGMMLILLGGSFYGLRAFHQSNATLVDQLRELGASKELLQRVAQLKATPPASPEQRIAFQEAVIRSREALQGYAAELRRNTSEGHRADAGQDELVLAFLIDHDLTELLALHDPKGQAEPVLRGTTIAIEKLRDRGGEVADALDGPKHEELAGLSEAAIVDQITAVRVERLHQRVMSLPDVLHRKFFGVLQESQRHYHSSRILVAIAALAVLAMLVGLTRLVQHWVLGPVRLLKRGVRRVTRGDFAYKIRLNSGDEMQALAEAFNQMTTRLQDIYHDLEDQVEQRSKQLVRSERLAGVGYLAAGVAHEINNPLASIALSGEALEDRLKPILESRDDDLSRIVANYVRMIQDEAFRCKRITERLLDFSRPSEAPRAAVDLTAVVTEVIDLVNHMAKSRERTIVLDAPGPVHAHANGGEIKQVALNLVVNALESMEPGGTLNIRVTSRSDGRAEMVFRDDGCGMSAETLEDIFEPFFTKREVGQGTGLGLAISHQIISQHRGEIVAESPGEGQGATFLVRLPGRPAAGSRRRGPSAA